MNWTRRHALAWTGAATTAGAAGLALWRWQSRPSSEAAALWSMHFEQPDGGMLAMARFQGRPLILNFWATWCPPCVREMPALDRFHRKHAAMGWQVVGIAADNVAPVREFLARTPVGFPVGLAGFAGIELARQLGNAGGGLPFSVVFDGRGRVVQRHAGEIHEEELTTWAKGIS